MEKIKEKALDLLDSIAQIENSNKIDFAPYSEPYNVHQEHVEICRWLISVLQSKVDLNEPKLWKCPKCETEFYGKI